MRNYETTSFEDGHDPLVFVVYYHCIKRRINLNATVILNQVHMFTTVNKKYQTCLPPREWKFAHTMCKKIYIKYMAHLFSMTLSSSLVSHTCVIELGRHWFKMNFWISIYLQVMKFVLNNYRLKLSLVIMVQILPWWWANSCAWTMEGWPCSLQDNSTT